MYWNSDYFNWNVYYFILGGVESGLGGTVWVPISDKTRLSADDPKPDYTIKRVTDLISILNRRPGAPELEDSSSNASDGSWWEKFYFTRLLAQKIFIIHLWILWIYINIYNYILYIWWLRWITNSEGSIIIAEKNRRDDLTKQKIIDLYL